MNVQEELFDNFQERVQLRRGLCELEAQNSLNMMEIKKGQKELLRYTLSRSGNLVEKNFTENAQDGFDKMDFNLKQNVGNESNSYPKNVQKQMNQINTLKASVDLNYGKREAMKSALDGKTGEAHKVLGINKISLIKL